MINQVRKDALSKNLQERFQAAIRKGDLELVSLIEGEADYLGIDLWITVNYEKVIIEDGVKQVPVQSVHKQFLLKNLLKRFQVAMRKGDLELVSLIEGEADYLGIDLWVTV